jgi:hypothetical protein
MDKKLTMIKTETVGAAKETEKKSLARKHNRRLNKLRDELVSLQASNKEKRSIHTLAVAPLSELEKISWDETMALLKRVST